MRHWVCCLFYEMSFVIIFGVSILLFHVKKIDPSSLSKGAINFDDAAAASSNIIIHISFYIISQFW